MAPLEFWRTNAPRFPALSALARDILSISATGAGVERLFNTARDICHYRRGRLHASTIQELMMYLCTSKFDKEEQDSALLQEFFTRDEIEEAKEEKGITSDMVDIDPVSDTEEDTSHEEGQDIEDLDSTVDIVDHIAEPTLPSNSESSTQPRTNLRARKRVRRDEDVYGYH